MPRTYTLERTQLIPRPLREVFPFFSDAKKLEAITPAFLQFKILTPGRLPCSREPHRLSHSSARHSDVLADANRNLRPPRRFTDIQIRGPYRLWHHTHEFRKQQTGR
jgi:ligand-binding SRPBCC domain-containing protein